MSKYTPGENVLSNSVIYLTSRDGQQTDLVLAEEDERMVVRSSSPLEVSAWRNPLMAFEVKPHQIRPE